LDARRRTRPGQRRAAELNDDETHSALRPGTISKVAPTQRDPERVSIYIDGTFALALPAIEAVQRGLQPGKVLDDEAVQQLQELAEVDKATNAALQFVAYRPRAEREVRDRLRRRDFSPTAIDAAIDKLRGWRYLDDRAFAELWVENRAEHHPRGRRALQAELRAKGIDREIAGEVIEGADINEADAALELARKRLGSLTSLDEPTQKRRLTAFLSRKGYGWDVIKPVLTQLYAGDEDELGDVEE
jgi:regulatory protein